MATTEETQEPNEQRLETLDHDIDLLESTNHAYRAMEEFFPLSREEESDLEDSIREDLSNLEIVVEYILTCEKSYNKSRFLADNLEEEYGRNLSTKEIGHVFPILANELGLSTEEYEEEFKEAYTNSTSWKLENIRETYGEQLKQLLDFEIKESNEPEESQETSEETQQDLDGEHYNLNPEEQAVFYYTLKEDNQLEDIEEKMGIESMDIVNIRNGDKMEPFLEDRGKHTSNYSPTESGLHLLLHIYMSMEEYI